ncbi:hypothetical protein BCU68_05355 [Vibrio sp. 10N.286.49.B3]|uniref:DUF3549 family protein n=1 Tax=Vibrio sp. 10N.286.49.B3 TaxID=1880855 RepID=UPI000C83468C|nr:DUF3549 family protein [Vibrio sp. 10N.286.49.B3]PMH41109.1 hypothetical protein BCU68_05355 [Vibrio sp. 10N.286.49.B3]
MDTINSLTQLLQQSGCQYKIFDLGRRIQPITSDVFESVEQGMQPYPYPLQRHANLAIAYWNSDQQPWIWFLKFSLDERGLFKHADIGNFLKYVLEAMGSRLNQTMSEEQQEKLANNPYTFKPSEDKMALFHSQIRAQLKLPTSQYYPHALAYFKGDLGWDNWQTVGLQGITDIAARLDENQNTVTVRKALPHLSNEPLYALLGALEHVNLNDKLSERLVELIEQEINSDERDLFLISALVRALSGGKEADINSIVKQILASPTLSHQEILIGIAGRAWQTLCDSSVAEQFLLRLAQTRNQTLFNQLFADLVMLPSLRMVLLPILHANPSVELTNALNELQKATKS